MLLTSPFFKHVPLLLFLLSSVVVAAQEPDPFDETPPDFETPAPATPLNTLQHVLLGSGVVYGLYSFRKTLKNKSQL